MISPPTPRGGVVSVAPPLGAGGAIFTDITAQFTKRPTLVLEPCFDWSADEGFQFRVMGEFGVRYDVQKNDAWLGWLPLATVTNFFGVTEVNDPTATNATLRVYRAVATP